jgi:hypothetical protein
MSQRPSLIAELKAMTREAVKDVRATVHETYFGKSEHAPELGTPLNPTPQETTKERGQEVNVKTDKISDVFGPSQIPQQEAQAIVAEIQKQSEQGQQKQQERGGRG